MNMISLLAAPELTHFLAKFIDILNQGIGNVGWTVVIFTLIIKLILSPLDLWQKLAQRKQSLSMARIQPQLLKIQERYADKPDILRQKQAELYKKEKIGIGSTIGMCLPLILTMVIFFVVLSGFNEYVRYQNELIIFNMAEAYQNGATPEQLAALYQPQQWLWIHNLYMPDNWSSIIPTFQQYAGSGLGALNAQIPDIVNIPDWYTTLVGPAQSLHKGWNGYLILPILCVALSVLQTKVMQSISGKKKSDQMTEQEKQTAKTTKVMMIAMPIMMGVFSLFYTSAFALYILTSSLFSFVFGLTFNLIVKAIDKKREANAPVAIIR